MGAAQVISLLGHEARVSRRREHAEMQEGRQLTLPLQPSPPTRPRARPFRHEDYHVERLSVFTRSTWLQNNAFYIFIDYHIYAAIASNDTAQEQGLSALTTAIFIFAALPAEDAMTKLLYGVTLYLSPCIFRHFDGAPAQLALRSLRARSAVKLCASRRRGRRIISPQNTIAPVINTFAIGRFSFMPLVARRHAGTGRVNYGLDYALFRHADEWAAVIGGHADKHGTAERCRLLTLISMLDDTKATHDAKPAFRAAPIA